MPRKGEEPLCSEMTSQILRYAKKKTGWTWGKLAIEIGLYKGKPERARIEAKIRLGHGQRINFENFLALCKIAGFPRAYAIVLWAQASIPDDYRDMRRFVGLSLAGFRRTSWPRNLDEEGKKYLYSNVMLEARRMPKNPEDYTPGMKLPKPTTKH